jgi:hypothetical protein
MASCLLRRKCGAVIAVLIVGGRDILHESMLGTPSPGDISDTRAERVGLDLAGWSGGSCEQLCLAAFPPIQGPPIPPHLRLQSR